MLRPQDDPSKIAYSFTLFERRDGANLVRVQTDSVNQPFDINQGARLNLGSTAKLRAVITYLQIVTELHERYASMSAAQLRAVKPDQAGRAHVLGARLSFAHAGPVAARDARCRNRAQVFRESGRDVLHGRRRTDVQQLRSD